MSDDPTPSSPALPPAAAAQDEAQAADQSSVGYGCPPPEHRFKAGDGRPRGRRPKGGRNVKTMLREEYQRTVRVQENGEIKRASLILALLRKDLADALKGKEKAVARHIALALSIAAEDEAKAQLRSQRETLEEDEAILARYLKGEP